VILHVYFQALRWGFWEEVISYHGGQFICEASSSVTIGYASISGLEFITRCTRKASHGAT
jgi:hypothetical protein